MKVIRTLVIGLLASVATTALASRAVNLPRKVTLQDGTEVTIRVVGDERLNFFTTTEGKIVMQEGKTYRYATMFEAEDIRKRAEMLQNESNSKPLFGQPTGTIDDGIEEVLDSRPFPHMGTPKVLTIMASFANLDFTYNKSDLDELYNGSQYHTGSKQFKGYGSVAQYFADCSNNKFRPIFDIVAQIKLDKDYEYYGAGSDRAYDICTEAMDKAASQGVDFSQYDNDGDGYVDLVNIIFAGYSEASGAGSEYIWPKAGYDSRMSKTYNGKKVFRYALSNELLGYPGLHEQMGLEKPVLTGIGTQVHEFSHAMGMSDFYPTVTWTKNGEYDVDKYDNQSMEKWDIMDDGANINNGFSPIPYSAWERELMGWTAKMEILDSRQDVTLLPLNAGGEGKRIVNDNEKREFWILENVPKDNGWYAYCANSGMLVTHIDYEKKYFTYLNAPNNEPGKPRITIIPADGFLSSSYRQFVATTSPNYMSSAEFRNELKGDPYPYEPKEGAAVNSLTDYKAYYGKVNKPITNITRTADGAITFKFMGGNLLIGDVNGDGVISMADANAITNYYLGVKNDSFNIEAADVNGDGEITTADANAVTNMFLQE